ncbi:MAG: class I SAM-dependent methyltransferase [Kofleriaceae bacterium]
MLDEARRTSFDKKAAQYEAVRPSYPEALVDDVLARTGARRLLEIGAGTGKATEKFMQRDCTITALEPGAQLAAVLRAKASANVRIEQTRFEDFPDTGYDLVYAAQAFHWVEPAVRFAKAAAVARWLAVITTEKDPIDPDLRAELDVAYDRWMADASDFARHEVARTRAYWLDEIDTSGYFGPVHVGAFPWHTSYATREYIDLLDTYSDHATLPADRQTPLYDAIAQAIDRRGGRIAIPYVTLVFLAERR